MWKKLPVPFLYIFLTGLVLGLVIGFRSYTTYLYWEEAFVWQRHVIPHVINYTFWPLLVPIVFDSIYRFPLSKSWKMKVMALLLSLGLSFFHEAVTNIMYYGLLDVTEWYPFTPKVWKSIKGGFTSSWIMRWVEFWIIYGLLAALEYYRKYESKQVELAQMENQLANARLNALKMQLQPHFLFNTLHTISSLMEIDTKGSQKVLARLGDLLRGILDSGARQKISLAEELVFVKNYLYIEEMRFHDRLRITYDIDPESEQALVPAFILQPLIENAIKHGFAKISGKGQIEVYSRVENGSLLIRVGDNGNGSQKNASQLFSEGIGLQNVKERLEQLYGNEAQINIKTGIQQGFNVHIKLPLEKS